MANSASASSMDGRAVADSPVSMVLAALVLLMYVQQTGQARGDGKDAAANHPLGAIVFVVEKANCPPPGSRRPCYGNSNVWVVNGDGSGLKPLTQINSWQVLCRDPVWSPDGTRIAFFSNRALNGADTGNTDVTSNIWVMNADGTHAKPLTKLTQPASSVEPVWSPTGHELAFISTGPAAKLKAGSLNIWVVHADGSGASPLTHIATDQASIDQVVWSPDGRRLAYVSTRALNGSATQSNKEIPNVWVINADGSEDKPVTKTTAANTAIFGLVWSPDGHQLAFTWRRSLGSPDATNSITPWNIWTVNSDGSHLATLTKLTADLVSVSHPAWSPDGSRLVFDSNRALNGADAVEKRNNIWLIGADGTGAKPLTKLTGKFTYSSNPIWSSDGSLVAFASQRALDGSDSANASRANNIWIMKADGTGAVPLTRFTTSSVVLNNRAWRP